MSFLGDDCDVCMEAVIPEEEEDDDDDDDDDE